MTAPNEAAAAAPSGSAATWRPILIAAGVLVLIALAALRLDLVQMPGHSPNRSASIATSIGAYSCSRTNYEITNRLDGSKTTVYDCVMADGVTEKCVTEENGLVHDQTATVKLLFTNTLGSSRPTCAT